MLLSKVNHDASRVELYGDCVDMRFIISEIDRKLDYVYTRSESSEILYQSALESLRYELQCARMDEDSYCIISDRGTKTIINNYIHIDNCPQALTLKDEHDSLCYSLAFPLIEAGLYSDILKPRSQDIDDTYDYMMIQLLGHALQTALIDRLGKKLYARLISVLRSADQSETAWLYVQWLSYQYEQLIAKSIGREALEALLDSISRRDMRNSCDLAISYNEFNCIAKTLMKDLNVDDLCLDEIEERLAVSEA